MQDCSGEAILSKTPMEDVLIGFDEYESEGTRIITASINKTPIVNTCVPRGVNPLLKEFREKLD